MTEVIRTESVFYSYQEGTLARLLEAAMESRKLGVFDGDTPRDKRRRIQQSADFMITNRH